MVKGFIRNKFSCFRLAECDFALSLYVSKKDIFNSPAIKIRKTFTPYKVDIKEAFNERLIRKI